MRDFWRPTFLLPRAAMCVAALAALLNLASYAGLTMRGPFEPIVAVHLVVMVLGFALFVRILFHHVVAVRALGVRVRSSPVPKALIVATVLALVYLLVLSAWVLVTYGEGSPVYRDVQEVWVVGGNVARTLSPGSVETYAARELRLFSAAWLMFSLLIAWAGHVFDGRLRGYRAARQAAV